jgi:hypothetical protein
MKRGLAALAFAVLAAVVAACGTGEQVATSPAPSDSHSTTRSTPTPEPVEDDTTDEPATLALGDTATITTDGQDSGEITVSKLRITTRPYDEFGSPPKRDYFLIFTMKLSATGNLEVFDSDFYVLTGKGEHIDATDGNAFDAIDYDDALSLVELHEGEHKTGLLAFDAPSKHGKLAYAPNYEGGPIVVWKF